MSHVVERDFCQLNVVGHFVWTTKVSVINSETQLTTVWMHLWLFIWLFAFTLLIEQALGIHIENMRGKQLFFIVLFCDWFKFLTFLFKKIYFVFSNNGEKIAKKNVELKVWSKKLSSLLKQTINLAYVW